MGRLVSDVMPVDAAQVVMASIHDAHEYGYSSGKQFSLNLPQGELWFELSVSRKGSRLGESSRFIVLARDITERHNAQEQLRVSDIAMKAISQGVMISGPDSRILSTNAAFTAITGYSEAEIVGRTCSFVQGAETDVGVVMAIKQAQLQAIEFQGQILNYRKDGSSFWNELSVMPVFDGKGRGSHFIGITRDITERKQTEAALTLVASDRADADQFKNDELIYLNEEKTKRAAELVIANDELTYQNDEKEKRAAELAVANVELAYQSEEKVKRAAELVVANVEMARNMKRSEEVWRLAFYDALTNLPNRRLLDDRLAQSMAASKRSHCNVALMMLDLDNFKHLNDAHGHVMGDLLLVEVGRRLKACVREIDTVARFGGDEFVVLLNELDTDKVLATVQVRGVAEKIRASLDTPYQLAFCKVGGQNSTVTHRCSASIGVVVFANHEFDQMEVMKWADAAMYEAKHTGRNLVEFHGEVV